MDFAHLNVLLPVGISFYTFQTLSYTIDIYRGKLAPTSSFQNFALFVAFFPQLVAGPIERAAHLLPQIERQPDATGDDLREGFALVTMGMFKKIMIGDTCGRIVDQIFADPSLYSSGELLMGAMLFCIQIYADFSGYGHIARGTARFFGIHIMVNFEQPYLSANITEFWRRWHISLSSWLRDYLYVSAGGNRKGRVRTYLNLMITMLLGGLWHGAMYTYIFWGFLQGLFLSVHKIMLKGKKVPMGFSYTGVGNLVTFVLKVIGTHILVPFGFLFFRAQSFEMAWYILKKWIFWEPGQYGLQVFTIVFTYYFVTYLIDILEYVTRDHTFVLRLKPAYRYGLYLAIWIVTLVYMFQVQPMPFIYFQF